jgi:hypothetical protein
MQMKTALADMARNRVASFGIPDRPRCALVAQSIIHSATAVQMRAPPDLDEIARRLFAQYRSGQTPERRDLNKAPWCIWNGNRPIAEDGSVLKAFLGYVEASGANRLFRRLASVYLVTFPKGQRGFGDVARTLENVAPRFDGPWSKAAADLDLFKEEGPRRLVEAAFTARRTPCQILESFGIGNLPTDAKYIEAAFLLGLQTIHENPSRNPDQHLQNVKIWGLRQDGSVAFEQHRGTLVDALVLPYSDPTPPKQVRDNYLSVLVSKFGDPRLRSGRWNQMPTSARVIRRWLTDQSLRQFLDVLDDSALTHQWKYRRAFWEAVYHRNLIAEAWVIFDKVGAQRAKRIFKTETPFAHWEIGGSKQIQSGQACLLLRIGRGIIAEWSHNGRCHIWHDVNDSTAPTMHKKLYRSDEVMVGKGVSQQKKFRRAEIYHQNSKGYTWQTKIADEIANMTGIRVHQREYQVR